jgi:type I restriction enzyme R subunit
VRKVFFEAYKEIENLWEILSPSPELRDHIKTFKGLAQLYAAVRNAYSDKVGFSRISRTRRGASSRRTRRRRGSAASPRASRST